MISNNQTCVKCGHDARWLRNGICGYFKVPITELVAPCGCKCVFPEPAATSEQNDFSIALKYAQSIDPTTETVFTDNQGTWYGARLDNHPTTKSFELCSLCKQINGHEDECPEGYKPLESYCPHGAVVGSNECLLCGPTAIAEPAGQAPSLDQIIDNDPALKEAFDIQQPKSYKARRDAGQAESTELLPCPFPLLHPDSKGVEKFLLPEGWVVRCFRCGTKVRGNTEREVIALWNTRAATPAPAAAGLIQAIRDLLPREIDGESNLRVPDDRLATVVVSFGELRRVRAALEQFSTTAPAAEGDLISRKSALTCLKSAARAWKEHERIKMVIGQIVNEVKVLPAAHAAPAAALDALAGKVNENVARMEASQKVDPETWNIEFSGPAAAQELADIQQCDKCDLCEDHHG